MINCPWVWTQYQRRSQMSWIGSNNSKPEYISLQHILDDLICQKIGEDCYVHIYREFDFTKKRAVVDLFNEKESRKLVMLIEKSSCQPSIKLSSMDCVILFNSDWSPINDMKPLRKMSIQSKFDHLKVFRFYLSNSVEEKALTLVKDGITLESSLNLYSYNISHKLLLWGTSYLFSKLDELHRHCSSIADVNCLSEDKLVFDVLNELSALLSCQESDKISCSLISRISEANAHYSHNIALHGEQDEPPRDDGLPPSAIWNSLLEGRNPLWKLLPGSAEKIRRRGEVLATATAAQNAECNNHDGKSKKKTLHPGDGYLCPKSRVGKVSKPASSRRPRNIAGYPKSRGNASRVSSCRDGCSSPSLIEETCLRRMRELILKQKKEIREFYRTKREDWTKLEEEHQSEVDLLIQRYSETPIKQPQLKKLDLIYEKKLEEHNRKMDAKRKQLEDKHLASRLKEKQLKDKLFALLKTENLKTTTTSLVKLPLETASTQKTVDLIDNSSASTIMIPNTSVSESNHSQEIKLGMIGASVQCDDCQFLLDHVLRETKILSVVSDEENHTVSMPREEVSDTAESGTSTSVAVQQRLKEVQDGDCNIKAPIRTSDGEAEMRGAADLDATAAVNGQQRLEVHDGDYNFEAISGESDGEAKLRGAADCGTTATVAAQQRIEEVLDGDCDIDALYWESNGEADWRAAADLGTTATLAVQERIKGVQDGDCNTNAINGESNRKAELRGATGLGAIANVVACQRIKEMQDGDCNTNTINGELNGKTELRGAPDSGTNANVACHQRVEEAQDGDCISDTFVGESNGKAELRFAADSSMTATGAGQQRIEEMWDGDCNIEASIGASNGEAEIRGAAGTTTTVAADSSTTATVAGQQRIEEVWDGDCNIEACIVASNGEAEMRGATSTTTSVAADTSMTATVAGQQRIEEVRNGDCNIEARIGVSNGQAEMKGTAGTTTTVLGRQRMKEPMEFASSRLNMGNQVLVQPQTCIMTGYSSPLEQPMASANFPCVGASDVSNCQIRVHDPCELGQTQVPSKNLGSYDQPVMQTQLQSSVVQEQPHILNSGLAIVNQSVNSYFEESSSLRSNLLPSAGSNPLQNELLRMKKEEDEAVRLHEDKTTYLKSACAKEIQGIQKKYDMLLREAENALLQKKLELESHFRKVYANMLLADTVKSNNQKQRSSPISQEALLSAILQFSQFNLPVQSNVVASDVHAPPPVQVVNQLSELVTLDATTPHNFSTLHNMANPLSGYHARSSAPHLCLTSPSTSNMLTSFYGVTNQQTAVWPHGSVSSWLQPEGLPGSSLQLGGTPQNPLLL